MATIKQIPKDASLTVSTNAVSMQYPNTIQNTKMTLRQLVRPIGVVSPEHSSDDLSHEFQITAPHQPVHPNMHKARSFPRSPTKNTGYFHTQEWMLLMPAVSELKAACRSPFFCSNALIALARSLCKCLLAQLITASGANAVKGYLVRCACIYGTIPSQETENSDQEKTKKKTTAKTHEQSRNKKNSKPKNKNRTPQLGMVYPKAAMRRNDKAACVPSPERVILETTAQGQNLTR